MILPPLPRHPDPLNEWNREELCAIKAYGELCVKTVCGGKHPRKFSDADVNLIRKLHAQGFNYKGVSRQIEMSQKTFHNIVNKQGAYK